MQLSCIQAQFSLPSLWMEATSHEIMHLMSFQKNPPWRLLDLPKGRVTVGPARSVRVPRRVGICNSPMSDFSGEKGDICCLISDERFVSCI